MFKYKYTGLLCRKVGGEEGGSRLIPLRLYPQAVVCLLSAGDCLLRKRLCFAPLFLANVQCTASAVLEARCLALKVVEAVVTSPELDGFVPRSS